MSLSVIFIEDFYRDVCILRTVSAEQLFCQARQAQEVTGDHREQSSSDSGHLDLVLVS